MNSFRQSPLMDKQCWYNRCQHVTLRLNRLFAFIDEVWFNWFDGTINPKWTPDDWIGVRIKLHRMHGWQNEIQHHSWRWHPILFLNCLLLRYNKFCQTMDVCHDVPKPIQFHIAHFCWSNEFKKWFTRATDTISHNQQSTNGFVVQRRQILYIWLSELNFFMFGICLLNKT